MSLKALSILSLCLAQASRGLGLDGLAVKRLTCSSDEQYCGDICISTSDTCCGHSYYCGSGYTCGHGGNCCENSSCSVVGTYVYSDHEQHTVTSTTSSATPTSTFDVTATTTHSTKTSTNFTKTASTETTSVNSTSTTSAGSSTTSSVVSTGAASSLGFSADGLVLGLVAAMVL